MNLYPVNLKLTDRLCIVVGGGGVAQRKVFGLLAGGARVRVISPEVEKPIQAMAGEYQLEWFDRKFAEGDLTGAFLVFAATDIREVQLQVEKEAEKLGVLFNSADDPQSSKFHVPAHFRRGQMLVTVATGGGSPALSRVIRAKLESILTPEYAAVVELLSLIREKVVVAEGESQQHADIFHRLLKNGLVELVLDSDWFALQMMLLEELPEQVDGVKLLKKFLEKHG